ncbi:MAG: sulfite exporter TauE/SafE family protein [Caldimonas sp.]
MIAALAAASVLVGLLIGAVGIGGILLVPALVALGDMDIHTASATALFTFAFTGALSTWLFARRGSIDMRMALVVCAGALPFSFLGAWVNSLTTGVVLARIIGSVIVFAGINVLMPLWRPPQRSRTGAPTLLLLGVGAAAGFGSGLTGAGGPLFSVPLMLALGFDPLLSIGVSQVLQVISAASGTAANLRYGSIDFATALLIVPFELAGVAAGVVVAHRVDVKQLRRIAAWLCIVSGAVILIRAGHGG